MWQAISSLFSAPLAEQSQVSVLQPEGAGEGAPVTTSRFELNDAALIGVGDTLRQLNLDFDGIDVPRIAVVGVQSSGKSSVLESLTGIPFPRDSTTCTRGPIEVRLRKCETASDEKIRVFKQCNDARMGVRDEVGDVREFELSQDMSEELAHCIQAVVAEMLQDNESRGHSNFTDDVLVIEVCRTRQIPYTVIDLPGYFQCTNSNDRMQAQDKEKVHAMINDLIRPASTIILHVIPANVDKQTLESWKECNMHDPFHKRTLGVLTKFDVAGEDYRSEWVNRIVAGSEKEKFAYPLGMYVLRCRSADETRRGVTWEQMRSIEAAATNVWLLEQRRSIRRDLAPFLGVDNLSRALNQQLVQMIHKSLPHIQESIEQKMGDTKQQLDDLGDPVTNVPARRKLLSKVQTHINRQQSSLVDGESLSELLPGLSLPEIGHFERQMPLVNKSFLFILNEMESQMIDHVADVPAPEPRSTSLQGPAHRAELTTASSVLKTERNARMRFDPMAHVAGGDQLDAAVIELELDHQATSSSETPQISLEFDHEWVSMIEEMILNRKAHRMDGFVDFVVFKQLVQKLVNQSRRQVEDYTDRMIAVFRQLVMAMAEAPAAEYATREGEEVTTAITNSAELGIYRHLQVLLIDRFNGVVQEIRTEMHKLFDNELCPRGNVTDQQTLRDPAQAKKRKRDADDSDTSDAEQMLLRVHQYWAGARVRLVENICLTIRRVFVMNFLEQQMLDVLQEIDDETLAAVAQENDETRLFRRQLLQQLERYQTALTTIQQTVV